MLCETGHRNISLQENLLVEYISQTTVNK